MFRLSETQSQCEQSGCCIGKSQGKVCILLCTPAHIGKTRTGKYPYCLRHKFWRKLGHIRDRMVIARVQEVGRI